MKKIFAVPVIVTMLFFGWASGASAFTIGMLTQGSIANAANNLNYYTSQTSNPWTSITDAAFNAASPEALAATYDTLIFPWYVNPGVNADWTTRILPYMNAGGSVLWEDPNNIGEISGVSGLTLASGNFYTAAPGTVTLVPPFDATGAEGYYHIHYSILSASSDWDVFSSDGDGGIHGVYGEFGTNGGRMVLGVSDNLYHPNMSLPSESDHYNLLVNELNWLDSGSVTGIPPGEKDEPVIPEPMTLTLLGTGLISMMGFRRKK